MDYIGIGCCGLAIVLYLNTLSAGFVYDDRRAILGNADILSTTSWLDLLANDFWGTHLGDTGSHGSYRPVCTLSYKFNHWLGGLKPLGYHLMNVALHAIATGLVLHLSRQLLGGNRRKLCSGSTIAGLLFAVHPIHTEAVASLVGRADLFACIFYLLTVICYKRHVELRGTNQRSGRQWPQLAVCLLSAVLATLSKETAISALVVCGLYDVALGFCGQRDKNRRRSLCIIGVATLALVQFRLSLPRSSVPFATADNPTSKDASAWTRFLTFLYLPAFNAQLMLLPTTLSFDWSMDAIPRISSLADARNLVSTLFYGSLLTGLFIIGRQHLALHRVAGQQRINNAIKRRIQGQSSKASHADKGDVFRATNHSHSVLHKMSIVRDYLINGRGKNSAILAQSSQRSKRKPQQQRSQQHSEAALYYGAKEEEASVQQTQTMLSHLNGQTFGSSRRNGKATKIRSLTAYTGELDTSGSSTPTSTSSTYSSSSSSTSSSVCFNTAPVTSLSHVLEPHEKQTQEVSHKLPPKCIATLMALALLILPFLPATNLFFYVGFVIAERILYLPSVGFCLCIGIGFEGVLGSSKSLNAHFVAPVFSRCFPRRNKSLNGVAGGVLRLSGETPTAAPAAAARVSVGGSGKCFMRQSCSRVSQIGAGRGMGLMCTVILVLSTFSYRTAQRNFDWHDEESLYKSAIHVNPPKALGNLGSVLSAEGKYEEAKTVLLQALTHRPNMADVHFNLGVLFQNQRDFPKAVESFQRAIHYRPSLAVAYLNMGVSLIAMNHTHEAAKVLRKGSRLEGKGLRDRPAHENARMASLLQLGGLYTQHGKVKSALAVYREALHSHPPRYPLQGLYYRLADVLARLNQWTEAEKFHKAAQDVSSGVPSHQPSNKSSHNDPDQ